MAKVVLGKTPEQLREEEAKKQRELEAQIQEAQLERQAKLVALHKKQKTTKIAIISATCLSAAILVTFGTYNTFFKKTITVEDVVPTINASIDYLRFPVSGLDGYIRDNCESLFTHYASSKISSDNIKSISVDPNSCYITKVRPLNSTLAQVYFSVDVVVTENDTEVTDPNIIRQLKSSGFITNEQPTEPETTTAPEDTTEETTETIVEGEENTEEVTTESVEQDKPEETTEESKELPTVEATPESEETPSGTANEEDENIEEDHASFNSNVGGEIRSYYVTSKGAIMQTGNTTNVRYTFYIPVEYYIIYSATDENGNPAGEVLGGGYRTAGDMNLYTLHDTNKTIEDAATEDGKVYYNSKFTCDETKKLDEETTRKIQVRVNNILANLYNGEDTSQEFFNIRQFNSYNSRYDGINKITCYSEENAIGYNTLVEYNITTSQGFSYTLETWLLVVPDGSSWVIKDML